MAARDSSDSSPRNAMILFRTSSQGGEPQRIALLVSGKAPRKRPLEILSASRRSVLYGRGSAFRVTEKIDLYDVSSMFAMEQIKSTTELPLVYASTPQRSGRPGSISA
jgi:hypothetical protein